MDAALYRLIDELNRSSHLSTVGPLWVRHAYLPERRGVDRQRRHPVASIDRNPEWPRRRSRARHHSKPIGWYASGEDCIFCRKRLDTVRSTRPDLSCYLLCRASLFVWLTRPRPTSARR